MANADLSRRLFLGTAVGGAISTAAVAAPFLTCPEAGVYHGRLSSAKDEMGFPSWGKLRANGFNCHVYLDGIDQYGVVETADSREGWVTRAKLDVRGDIYTLDDETIARETVYGEVKIFVVKVT